MLTRRPGWVWPKDTWEAGEASQGVQPHLCGVAGAPLHSNAEGRFTGGQASRSASVRSPLPTLWTRGPPGRGLNQRPSTELQPRLVVAFRADENSRNDLSPVLAAVLGEKLHEGPALTLQTFREDLHRPLGVRQLEFGFGSFLVQMRSFALPVDRRISRPHRQDHRWRPPSRRCRNVPHGILQPHLAGACPVGLAGLQDGRLEPLLADGPHRPLERTG